MALTPNNMRLDFPGFGRGGFGGREFHQATDLLYFLKRARGVDACK